MRRSLMSAVLRSFLLVFLLALVAPALSVWSGTPHGGTEADRDGGHGPLEVSVDSADVGLPDGRPTTMPVSQTPAMSMKPPWDVVDSGRSPVCQSAARWVPQVHAGSGVDPAADDPPVVISRPGLPPGLRPVAAASGDPHLASTVALTVVRGRAPPCVDTYVMSRS